MMNKQQKRYLDSADMHVYNDLMMVLTTNRSSRDTTQQALMMRMVSGEINQLKNATTRRFDQSGSL